MEYLHDLARYIAAFVLGLPLLALTHAGFRATQKALTDGDGVVFVVCMAWAAICAMACVAIICLIGLALGM